MWCVASAPIVPLARDLDAALGTQLSELAVHFRKLSAPLPTAPPPLGHTRVFSTHRPRRSPPPHSPLGQHPNFLHKVFCRFLAPPSLSRAASAFFPQGAQPLSRKSTPLSGTPAFLPHTAHAAPTRAGSLRAFPHLRHVPPRSTPLPPRRHRSDGTFFR